MEKIKLKYQCIQTMVGAQDVALIVLTDEQETRQLNVFCNGLTRLQILVRTNDLDPSQIKFSVEDPSVEDDLFSNNIPNEEEANEKTDLEGKDAEKDKRQMLPEVLVSIMQYLTNVRLEIYIYNIYDGEYKVALVDATTGTSFVIKAEDALLLHIVNRHIPITVDPTLWKHQSMPFKKDTMGVSLPINTLSVPMLKQALKRAIDDERYEAAKHIKEELERRK